MGRASVPLSRFLGATRRVLLRVREATSGGFGDVWESLPSRPPRFTYTSFRGSQRLIKGSALRPIHEARIGNRGVCQVLVLRSEFPPDKGRVQS